MRKRRWPWISMEDWIKMVYISHRLVELESCKRIPIVPGRPEDFGK